MPAKKKPVIPAAEMKAKLEGIRFRAKQRLDQTTLGTLSYMAVQQVDTVTLLKEILAQLKKTNKTLIAILSANAPDEVDGIH